MDVRSRLLATRWISRHHFDIAYKRVAAQLHPELRVERTLDSYPEVTILVTTFNCKYPLELTLRSLRKHTTYPNYHILVAHNGSTDGTIELLQGLIDDDWPLEIIDSDGPQPQWWWYDKMMHEVETPYWIGLHQDMYFLSGDWLADLIHRMEREKDIMLLSGERSPYKVDVKEPMKGGIVDISEKPSTWLFCGRKGLGERTDASWNDDKRKLEEGGKTLVYEQGGRLVEDMRERGVRYEWMPSWYSMRWHHIGNLSWAFTIDISDEVRKYKMHQVWDCERRARALRN